MWNPIQAHTYVHINTRHYNTDTVFFIRTSYTQLYDLGWPQLSARYPNNTNKVFLALPEIPHFCVSTYLRIVVSMGV